jgi:AraC-like DNA-binding protein
MKTEPWSFSATQPCQSIIAADGCFDLIVEERAGERRVFVYQPVTAAHVAHIEAGTVMHGVRVTPGRGAALLACERELKEWVLEHDSSTLEQLVTSAVSAFTPPSVVQEFVAAAQASSGSRRLTSPATGAAERELQRACRQWLGLTPKVFLRIERAHAARRAIRTGEALAAIAVDLGYADQAHLTREVRHLLGVTPRSLRAVGNLQEAPGSHR